MAATAHGYSYVTPDDHPKEYPAVSQALAQKLETTVTAVEVTAANLVAGYSVVSCDASGLGTVSNIPAGYQLVAATYEGSGALLNAAWGINQMYVFNFNGSPWTASGGFRWVARRM